MRAFLTTIILSENSNYESLSLGEADTGLCCSGKQAVDIGNDAERDRAGEVEAYIDARLTPSP